jgi:thiamine biosynthesis lipoprotein
MRAIIISIFALLLVSSQAMGQGKAKKVLKLMGSRFEITVLADSDQQAWDGLNAGVKEIERIEKLISSWDPASQTSAINNNAGIKPVVVDPELYQLIFRSLKISKLTQGAFDISFGSMDRIWKFDRTEQVLPPAAEVAEAARHIGWENIILNEASHSVFLKEKGMKIGFGAIGKGYAANRAKAIIEKMPGVKGGVVNASGDLIAWGENHEEENWKIQIADPKNKEKSLGWLSLKDMAIVTSGDYEKYFTSDGKRYAHIIDPTTGYPTTGVKSVSIICPDAEVADALATSVFVLGKEKGLALINQLNQIECIIITDDDAVHTSTNLQLNYQ